MTQDDKEMYSSPETTDHSQKGLLLSAPIYLLYFTLHSEFLILRSCIHIYVTALPQQCSPSCEISGLSLQNLNLTPALSQVPVARPPDLSTHLQ